jgi:twitching motility protein PilT
MKTSGQNDSGLFPESNLDGGNEIVMQSAPGWDADRDLITDIVTLIHSDLVFTDLMIEEDAPIMARTPNGWEDTGLPVATKEDIKSIYAKIDPNWEGSLKQGSLNRPLDLSKWRLRINAYLAGGGDKYMLSIRKIPALPIPLKETGLPQSVRLMFDSPRGLILVNGATGSGKSTTLASIVDAINETRSAHVITVEDPIEYIFQRKKSIFSQREVGVDAPTFFDGVRDAMRQRPDVIVIGEIRDRDTAETALLAAESGVFVIATIHAGDAPGAIQKLLSFFPAPERETKAQSLAASLVGVISQLLLPSGTSETQQGWVLAAELMFNHKQQISELIATGDIPKLLNHLSLSADKISRTMEDSLFDLVQSKRLDETVALRAVSGARQEKLKAKLANK